MSNKLVKSCSRPGFRAIIVCELNRGLCEIRREHARQWGLIEAQWAELKASWADVVAAFRLLFRRG